MTASPTPFAEGKATGSKMELVQPASAAMPSEEEMLTAYNAIWQAAPGIDAHNVDIVRREAISAVRALFAPILAEKEHFRIGCERLSVRLHIAKEERDAMEARALAAEAALAAVEKPGTYFANQLQHEWIGPDGIRYSPTRERRLEDVEF